VSVEKRRQSLLHTIAAIALAVVAHAVRDHLTPRGRVFLQQAPHIRRVRSLLRRRRVREPLITDLCPSRGRHVSVDHNQEWSLTVALACDRQAKIIELRYCVHGSGAISQTNTPDGPFRRRTSLSSMSGVWHLPQGALIHGAAN